MYFPARETVRANALKVVVTSISIVLVMPDGSVVVLRKGYTS
jgi:hypothetical protein